MVYRPHLCGTDRKSDLYSPKYRNRSRRIRIRIQGWRSFQRSRAANATNPGITCPAQVRTLTNWYNPCAFANPLPGNQITAPVTSGVVSYLGPPRYQTYGPGYNNTNLSLFKDFTTFHEQHLQFGVDMFNVWNTAVYGTPSALSVNSGSGYITTALSLGAYTPILDFSNWHSSTTFDKLRGRSFLPQRIPPTPFTVWPGSGPRSAASRLMISLKIECLKKIDHDPKHCDQKNLRWTRSGGV
jgi:hypothetical protein